MTRSHEDQQLLLNDLDAIDQAMAEHLTTIETCRERSRALRARVASGVAVRDALSEGPMSTLRHSMTESIDRLEHARHDSRISLVAVGLREGMSIADFGRIWGISRQLASRYAREAAANERVSPPA